MADTLLLVEMLVLLVGIGALAGVIAGLLGVGGGIVLVPSFYYTFSALGYGSPQLMQICLATSLATIVVTSMRSLASHNKKGAVDWETLRRWAPGIVVGALAGVAVAAALRSSTLQAIFGVLGVIVALYLGFGRTEWRLGQTMPGRVTTALLSPVVGFLSVLMGIGGGSFGVPLMTLYDQPIHRAVATASGFGMTLAIPSVLAFLFVGVDPAVRPPLTVGSVNLVAFAIIVTMTLVTTPYGVKLAHATDAKPLRRIFAAFLAVLALNMLRKASGW
ncbi:MAG: sulfite exporter TauE/SafE family protein [Tranquillimonas sp.]|jgi:uncharacterized membrane protein YfcA